MNRIMTVFRKELREMFRDKRVRSGAFVMPVFMIVLFVQIFGLIEDKVSRPQTPKLAIVDPGIDSVAKTLSGDKSGQTTLVKTREEGVRLVERGKAKLLVEFGPDFEKNVTEGRAKITATYDPTEPLSGMALGAFQEKIKRANDARLREVLSSHDVDPSMAEPIRVTVKETSRPKGLGGSSMVNLLPYFIVIWAFYGGMSIVSDLVAGEKERGTMETLLVSPVRRREVALGKYLALALVCLLSSLTAVVGIVLVGVTKFGYAGRLFPTGLSISFASLAAMTLTLLPLVLLMAGILISVSAAAKNMREAQTYLTLVSFIVIMPAVFSQIIGFTDMQNALWVKLVPVLGSAVSLKEALLAKTDWPGLFAGMAVCGVLAAVFLAFSVSQFERESIVSRS
ncbi:MAG: ABC transporter permease [Armatimonadetes bacterium]|nr:ABC transporter permease [Armatimonadota bacterium]